MIPRGMEYAFKCGSVREYTWTLVEVPRSLVCFEMHYGCENMLPFFPDTEKLVYLKISVLFLISLMLRDDRCRNTKYMWKLLQPLPLFNPSFSLLSPAERVCNSAPDSNNSRLYRLRIEIFVATAEHVSPRRSENVWSASNSCTIPKPGSAGAQRLQLRHSHTFSWHPPSNVLALSSHYVWNLRANYLVFDQAIWWFYMGSRSFYSALLTRTGATSSSCNATTGTKVLQQIWWMDDNTSASYLHD